jgi:hypothetical protein
MFERITDKEYQASLESNKDPDIKFYSMLQMDE